MFLKLADKGDMGKVLEEFENWPDQIINLRVTFLWLLKKPLFGFVISITPSVLIRCSWNLQIRCTWMKSWTSLKTGQIRSLVLEFIPFIAEKASVWLCHQHNSIGFDQMFLKLPEQVDMDEILDEFENWPDQIMDQSYVSDCCKGQLASVWLCHQRNLFSFARIFLKLADQVDMDEISDKLKNWPDWIIDLRVTSPWLLKKHLFDFVISITHSVLIGSSWNLQIRETWM